MQFILIIFTFQNLAVLSTNNYSTSDYSTNLKEVLAKKIPTHNKKVVEFRKAYGGTVIQEITVDMVKLYIFFVKNSSV